ncbi:AAA family ATPase [Actinosynnema sp. NPDC023794]
MYVKRVKIYEFRNIRDVEFGPFEEPGSLAELVALTGPNGGGKSSVLELIAYVTSTVLGNHFEPSRGSSTDFRGVVTFGFRDSEIDFLKRIEPSSTGIAVEMVDRAISTRSLDVTFDLGLVQDQPAYACQRIGAYLRQYYQRSVGLFIRADRGGSRRYFDRQEVFNYGSTRLAAHADQYSFRSPDQQYQDIYNHLTQLSYHHNAELGRVTKLERAGEASIRDYPPDPLDPYTDLLDRVFPGYSFADQEAGIPTDLFISLPSGHVIAFNELSSGEKEVFLLLSFFIRHSVRNAVILIDEPELHLHPQLSRALVREVQRVSPGSQVWMATHNAEIIDEVGRDKVFYMSRSLEDGAISVSVESEHTSQVSSLRHLFGDTGYVGVGRTLVFSEGQATSADRKTFTRLFPDSGSSIKIVPVGGVESHLRVNSAILALLEDTFAWVQFYLVRDRDYLTEGMVEKYKSKSRGKIHVLSRCQIENYLLEFDIIADVLADMYDIRQPSSYWRDRFGALARQMSGEVASSLVAYRLNQIVAPQDFSLPKLNAGKPLVAEDGSFLEERLQTLKEYVHRRTAGVSEVISEQLKWSKLESKIDSWLGEVAACFSGDADGWVTLFPGKDLLSRFVKEGDLGPPVLLINGILKEMANRGFAPGELHEFVARATKGEPLV